MVTEFAVQSFFSADFCRQLIRGSFGVTGLEALGNLRVRIERRERLVKITQFNMVTNFMATMNRVLALQPSRSFLAFNQTVNFPWIVATSSHDFISSLISIY